MNIAFNGKITQMPETDIFWDYHALEAYLMGADDLMGIE